MKRFNTFLAFVILIALFVSGCGSLEKDNGKISIVCTNFAVYDWVNEIIGTENGERFDVKLLSGSGDIHSYQPTAKDMTEIRTCNLFVYIGGTSDEWAEKIVTEGKVNSLKLFDMLKDDLICGEHDHGEHEHKVSEYDEHIWLSLKSASKAVDAICEKLAEVDAASGDTFRNNADVYVKKLSELDAEYLDAVGNSKDKTIVFADRFPFAYLVRDYGIEAIAAFPGCSADVDASFDTITKLVNAVDEYGKKTVLVLENSNQSVANTVIEGSKAKTAEIAVMNSCQMIGEKEIKQGADYLEIMRKNLDALKSAIE